MSKKDVNSIDDYGIDFERVVELLSTYEQRKKSGEIKRLGETETRESFINPLFKALGWNMENRLNRNDSVNKEENIAGKRSDYSFRINGIPKFFLEAKSLKEENIQTNSKYVDQAINYAWMKSCSWAILCNFETIAVFNADWKGSNFGSNLLFVLHPSDFLSDKRFEYLSKKAFLNNELDNIASQYGKKQTKNPINKQLLQDMIHFRAILSKDIIRNNQERHLSQDDLDESVQRILDRLIFIRNAEDRELEEKRLQPKVRQWASRGRGQLVREISKIYSYFDEKYNSKLFAKHLCDDLYLDNEVLIEVIEGLNHSKDNSYRYDFSILESDVLGNIYEQYLGNILKATPKRAKLSESKAHRKEQGIYYTPSHIVDYIVKKTIGEYIKTHTPEEIKNVKIIDPACGSGSFLIRAYKELEAYWENKYKTEHGIQETLKFDEAEDFYSRKVEILKNNIFGVDLDPKAVEIAQLNLLLQISERKHRLPLLQNNIKVGNSLIDDPTVSERAFKWEEKFPEIMKDGGFNIVIGNPPYVFTRDVEFKDNFKNFVQNRYFSGLESEAKNRAKQSGKVNLYAIFLMKSIMTMRNSGLFSFIIPNNILRTTTYDTIRKFILENCRIKEIVDLGSGVFEGVTASTIILVLQKEVDKDKKDANNINVLNGLDESSKTKQIRQGKFAENTSYVFNITLGNNELSLINKLERKAEKLGNETKYIIEGIVGSLENDVADSIINEKCKKFLTGKDIGRYFIDFKGKYIVYDRAKLHRARPEEVFTNDKIIIQRISGGKRPLTAVIDRDGYYTFASTNLLVLKSESKFDLRYILALLNSKLINWYYVNKFTNASTLTVNVSKTFLEQIPIMETNKSDVSPIIGLVDKMLTARKQIIQMSGKKTDKRYALEQKALDIDSEIDKAIYRIYSLTDKEIKVVESFFT